MKHTTPNTRTMEHALIDHAKGGPAIYKPELYLHATREAQARRDGYYSVSAWEAMRKLKALEWLDEFCSRK